MFDPKSIKVGMLVRNLEGDRLGRVVAREGGAFRVQQPGVVNAERFVVEDQDVREIRGAEIILREGPQTFVPETEWEARSTSPVWNRRNAEGWRTAGAPKVTVDDALQVGMPIFDIEGERIGVLTALGDGLFDLRCTERDELATVLLGDVLYVAEGRVVIRKGAEVLKNRRAERTDLSPMA
jgi:hypothetical protein